MLMLSLGKKVSLSGSEDNKRHVENFTELSVCNDKSDFYDSTSCNQYDKNT